MTVFRDCIYKEMKAYQFLRLEEGEFTIGALIHAVLGIHDEDIAQQFYQGYVDHLRLASPEQDASSVARANIGWCFGEGMSPKDKAMWVAVCDASHPIFGQATVTAEQALAEGMRIGRGERNTIE